MEHWYFDEGEAMRRVREVERQAERARALGLMGKRDRVGPHRLWGFLGRMLIALGNRLQGVDPVRRPDLACSSQCGLR